MKLHSLERTLKSSELVVVLRRDGPIRAAVWRSVLRMRQDLPKVEENTLSHLQQLLKLTRGVLCLLELRHGQFSVSMYPAIFLTMSFTL